MVITTAQLHLTKPELRFCAGSNPACVVSEIRDGDDLWQCSRLEIRLNGFRRSTIPQKQFIIMIIIIITIIFKWKECSYLHKYMRSVLATCYTFEFFINTTTITLFTMAILGATNRWGAKFQTELPCNLSCLKSVTQIL